MSSEYTPSSGRRSRHRGGRRQGRRGGRSSNRQETATPARPKKKTLWQQIVAFFGGEGKSSSAPAAKTNGSHTPAASPRREPRPERQNVARKPELVEVTSPRLYVGNLSFDATESDLLELFNGVGLVQNVEVVSNRHTHKSKGFAFVQMQTIDEARRAVNELHDKEYMGRKLVVSGAKGVEEKRGEREYERQPEQ